MAKQKSKSKREIWVADSETDPFKWGRPPEPFIWGAYNGKEYHQFTNTKDLIDFFKDKNAIVYAHNGGKFDWYFFFPFINEWEEEILLISGRLAKFTIGKCEFRDSFSILPIPLAAFQKTEIDYDKFEKEEREKPEIKAEIEAYLRDDCVDLYNLISRFIDQFGLNLTIAGASVKQWEEIENRKRPKTDAAYYNKFMPYYYGGRVECFKSGIIEKDHTSVDINSAYPYAMLSKHPIGTQFINKKGNPPKINGSMLLRLTATAKGCFPFRDTELNALTFPNDEFKREYFVTGWELLAALETNTVENVSIKEWYYFTEQADFKNYIKKFWDRRGIAKATLKRLEEEGITKGAEYMDAKADSLFCKLFMNSLYGRFAINPLKYNKTIIVPPEEKTALEINWYYNHFKEGSRLHDEAAFIKSTEDKEDLLLADGWEMGGVLGNWFIGKKPVEEEDMNFINIATAASITGYVRAYLWRAICSSEGVAYCDTDCVIAEKIGDFVKLGGELGEWEIEGEFDKIGIAGKKLYVLRGKRPKKGKRKYKKASKGAKLHVNQLWKVCEGHTVTHEQINPIYSISKAPYFQSRNIKATAKNFKPEKAY